ncbi:YidB family protein [Rhizobium sp. LjRoot254]|uniref:YidB family protein n=1 Tax=Rhizobium sp. LjRoot254 TaxID=3342297 RepID=UPI003F5079B0
MAGYQNRDKIADVLKGLQNPQTPHPDGTVAQEQGGLGGMLGRLANGGLGGLLGGSTPGGILSGGLGDLLDQFRQNGLGDRADTWVKTGPNEGIQDHELSQALGDDVLDELTQKTGLSKDEILRRLSRDLPKAVDDLTPDGSVPTEQAFNDAGTPSRTSVPNAGRIV